MLTHQFTCFLPTRSKSCDINAWWVGSGCGWVRGLKQGKGFTGSRGLYPLLNAYSCLGCSGKDTLTVKSDFISCKYIYKK